MKTKVLSGVEIVDTNYDMAKNRLTERYGNEESLLMRLRKQIFEIELCKTNREVHAFYYLAESLLKQMETVLAKRGKVLDGEDLLFFLQQRLTLTPHYVQKLVSAQKSHIIWNLESFRKALKTIIEDEEKVLEITRAKHQSESRSNPTHQRSRRDPPRKVNFAAVAGGKDELTPIQKTGSKPEVRYGMQQAKNLAREGAKKTTSTKTLSCLFCQKPHKLNECPLPNAERRTRIFQARRCVKCLGLSHFASQCSKEMCRKCKGSHHTFLCTTSPNANLIPLKLANQTQTRWPKPPFQS